VPGASRVAAGRYRPDATIVGRAVDAIVGSYQPERIIVFGSFARGDTHELSDLDLIVIKETNERFFRRIGRVRDTCIHLNVDLQPLVYTPREIQSMLEEGNDFLEMALDEGVVVYEEENS